jgi:hypothetical protein
VTAEAPGLAAAGVTVTLSVVAVLAQAARARAMIAALTVLTVAFRAWPGL